MFLVARRRCRHLDRREALQLERVDLVVVQRLQRVDLPGQVVDRLLPDRRLLSIR